MSSFEDRMKRIGVDLEGNTPPAEPQPPAEPTVDPPVTTPADPPNPAEPPSTTPTTDPSATPPVINKLAIAAEMLGMEFQDEESFNTFKSGITGMEERLKDSETKYNTLETEYNDIVGGLDASTLFASPAMEALNGLMKKFPGKNPLILAEIASKDLSKAAVETPLEILASDLMLENPIVYETREQAIEDIRVQYSINDIETIDAGTKRRLQVDAKKVVDKFEGLKGQIEKSKFIDLKKTRDEKIQAEAKRIENITAATESFFSKEITDALKDVEFTDTYTDENGQEVTEVAFKFAIGENFAKSKVVKDMLNSIRQNVIREGGDWTDDRAAKVKKDTVALLEAVYLNGNKRHIYQAMRDDIVKKHEDAAWVKRHNAKPLRVDSRQVPVDKAAEQLAKVQKQRLEARGIKVKT